MTIRLRGFCRTSRTLPKSIPGCRVRTGELPADRGWMVDRAFAFRRGRSEPGDSALLTHTLAGVLLSSVPQVVSARRGLVIEGVATLREVGICYRAVLLPLSENGRTIDHLLGVTNYRSLRRSE